MKLSSQHIKFSENELKRLEDHFVAVGITKTLDEWLIDRSGYEKTEKNIALILCLLNNEIEVCNRIAYKGRCGEWVLLSSHSPANSNCDKCKPIFDARMYCCESLTVCDRCREIFDARMYCESLKAVVKNYLPRLKDSPNYEKYVAYLLSEG